MTRSSQFRTALRTGAADCFVARLAKHADRTSELGPLRTHLLNGGTRAGAPFGPEATVTGYWFLTRYRSAVTDLALFHDAGVCKVGPTAAEARNRNGDRTAAVRSGRLRRDSEGRALGSGDDSHARNRAHRPRRGHQRQSVHIARHPARTHGRRRTRRERTTADGARADGQRVVSVTLLPGASVGRAQH